MKIPNQISLNEDGQYCIGCFSKKIERNVLNGLTFYRCRSCHQTMERSLVIDNGIVWWIDDHGVYWHESVGILVVVKDKLLTLLRSFYPFAYGIPAGHLDQGEIPRDAAIRELHEETNIFVPSLETIKENFDVPNDSCRRGCDHHRWHLYRVKLDLMPTVALSDESRALRFMTLKELQTEPRLTYPLKVFVDEIAETIFQ